MYSAKAVFMLQYWIQVLECRKISFNMIQSQFIFDKERVNTKVGKTLPPQWEPKFETNNFAFPSGCVREATRVCGTYPHNCVCFIWNHICVFKSRKWHSSRILCLEESGYDLSEQQQKFLSLPTLAGQIAVQLTALQSPGLPSFHPSAPAARTPPTDGF